MATKKTDARKIFIAVDSTTSELLQLVASFDEKEINKIPFEGSWTAAQVAEHVTRSNTGITKEFRKTGTTCEREPDAGVQKLKSIFLDFSTNLKSPEFILPTKDIYQKETVVSDLRKSIEDLKEVSRNEDLFQIINHALFGEITKPEMLHFVVYHTKKHIHQLKNIFRIIEDQKRK